MGTLYKFCIDDKYCRYNVIGEPDKDFLEMLSYIKDFDIKKEVHHRVMHDYRLVTIRPQGEIFFSPLCKKDEGVDNNILFIKNNKYNTYLCSICMEDFVGNTVIMLKCFHAYCRRCIDLCENMMCPKCRLPLSILYEVYNYKEYIISKIYSYKLDYDETYNEYNLMVYTKDIIIQGKKRVFEYAETSPLYIRSTTKTESIGGGYGQPLISYTSLLQGSMSEYFDASEYHFDTELKKTKIFYGFDRQNMKCMRIDGIYLCLNIKTDVNLSTYTNIIDFILDIDSISTMSMNGQVYFTTNTLQLLEYFLDMNDKERRKALRICKDKVIFDIDWKILFGIDNKNYCYYITQVGYCEGHKMNIVVNVNGKIYTDRQEYKIKEVICEEHLGEMLQKERNKEMGLHIPLLQSRQDMYGNGEMETVFPLNNCLIIKKILLLSTNEIRNFTIQLKGINVFHFEDFMCLKYYDKNRFFYVIDLKDGYDASSINMERLIVEYYDEEDDTIAPNIIINGVHLNILLISPEYQGTALWLKFAQ